MRSKEVSACGPCPAGMDREQAGSKRGQCAPEDLCSGPTCHTDSCSGRRQSQSPMGGGSVGRACPDQGLHLAWELPKS